MRSAAVNAGIALAELNDDRGRVQQLLYDTNPNQWDPFSDEGDEMMRPMRSDETPRSADLLALDALDDATAALHDLAFRMRCTIRVDPTDWQARALYAEGLNADAIRHEFAWRGRAEAWRRKAVEYEALAISKA